MENWDGHGGTAQWKIKDKSRKSRTHTAPASKKYKATSAFWDGCLSEKIFVYDG